jgi:hypothetical protein
VTTDYSAAEIEHLIAQANKVTVGDQRSSPTLTVLRRRAARGGLGGFLAETPAKLPQCDLSTAREIR